MENQLVSVTSRIDAPPQNVYAVLADYHNGHPHILPTQYFRNLKVEEGGLGAGTRTWVEMHVLGTTRKFHSIISEPEPGRVLVESEMDGDSVTTFTVNPVEEGGATDLTISTSFATHPGLAGAIERRLTSSMLRRVYLQEMSQLNDYVHMHESTVV
jgi:hypothetical protein